ncbi:hypothetical protein C0Z17_17880 [Trinickia caryophylli]|nr:hypothetical protein C0Z17_17880 [Trinickia caryophylli]
MRSSKAPSKEEKTPFRRFHRAMIRAPNRPRHSGPQSIRRSRAPVGGYFTGPGDAGAGRARALSLAMLPASVGGAQLQ